MVHDVAQSVVFCSIIRNVNGAWLGNWCQTAPEDQLKVQKNISLCKFTKNVDSVTEFKRSLGKSQLREKPSCNSDRKGIVTQNS